MLNSAIAKNRTVSPETDLVAPMVAAQRVVIVNGSPDILGVLETALDAGHYDVVFVESNAHAYSQIKRVQPDLVILCVRIDHLDGFQVLSMLKLDEATRAIPVLTYTSEYDDHMAEDDDAPDFAGHGNVLAETRRAHELKGVDIRMV